jgi:pSer/pThr/pTyr-binding forkhead associated (FHA) protein
MTDSLLNILKFALLALLYLFFARVLWAVWSEVRGPRPAAGPLPQAVTRGAVPHAGAAAAPAPAGPQPVGQSTATPGRAAKVPRGKRGAVARLIVIEPRASKGTAISVAQEVTFGRAPGCTVSVPDDTFVSQIHARVFNDQGNIILEDIGSTNGTYVNGTRLTVALALHKGDRIQIGSTVLEAN